MTDRRHEEWRSHREKETKILKLFFCEGKEVEWGGKEFTWVNDWPTTRRMTKSSRKRNKKTGEYQSGQMGQTVNLLVYTFGGSNPSSPTIQAKSNEEVARKKRPEYMDGQIQGGQVRKEGVYLSKWPTDDTKSNEEDGRKKQGIWSLFFCEDKEVEWGGKEFTWVNDWPTTWRMTKSSRKRNEKMRK